MPNLNRSLTLCLCLTTIKCAVAQDLIVKYRNLSTSDIYISLGEPNHPYKKIDKVNHGYECGFTLEDPDNFHPMKVYYSRDNKTYSRLLTMNQLQIAVTNQGGKATIEIDNGLQTGELYLLGSCKGDSCQYVNP